MQDSEEIEFEDLPLELVYQIALFLDLASYRALIYAYPAFGRLTLDPTINQAFQKLFTVEVLPGLEYHLNGVLHRVGGPAWISGGRKCYHPYASQNGDDVQLWYQHGQLHRTDGPALIVKSHAGKIIEEHWYYNGVLHREDGPAHISNKWRDDDVYQTWYRHGEKVVSNGGQYEIIVRSNGIIEHRFPCNDNDQPTYVKYYDGKLVQKMWQCKDGWRIIYSRASGPAIIEWKPNGDIIKEWKYEDCRERGPQDPDPHGPTYTIENKKGQSLLMKWAHSHYSRYAYRSQLHNPDGPAYVAYHANGKMKREAWYLKGVLHRDDGNSLNSPQSGPAYRSWDKKGRLLVEKWFRKGKLYRKNEDGPCYTKYNQNGQVVHKMWYHPFDYVRYNYKGEMIDKGSLFP